MRGRIGMVGWLAMKPLALPTRRVLRFALLSLSLSAVLAHADSDVWIADEPAKATPESLEAHPRSAAELEDRIVESGDLDSRKTEAGSLEGRETTAGDPDATAQAGRLDSRVVDAQKLSELPSPSPRTGAIGFETPNPASWSPTSDPELLAARNRYSKALDRTHRAIARYDEMRDENHPRGEARLAIVRERDESLVALRQAKRALEAAESKR